MHKPVVHDRHGRGQDSLARNLGRFSGVVALAIVLFTGSLLAFIAFSAWSADTSADNRDLQQIENALDQSTVRVLNELKSIAWWDEGTRHLAQPNPDMKWVDYNFGVYLAETYGQDEVYILDDKLKPIYAFRDGARVDPSRFEPRRADFTAILAELRGENSNLHKRDGDFAASALDYRKLSGPRQPRWSAHILRVDGQPAILAAINIGSNDDPTLATAPTKYLLAVSNTDRKFLTDLGTSLLVRDLRLLPKAVDGDASAPLFTDDGKRLGDLVWKPRRPGRVMFVVILPMVAIGMAAVAFLLLRALRSVSRASRTLEDREREASFRATHDQLSGLPNRRKFSELLAERRDPLRPELAMPTTVGYIDIDRFKDINDTLGHHAGDELIIAIASRLRDRLPRQHMLARFGGDEFAVLCDTDDPAVVDELSDAICDAFATPFVLNGRELPVTASAGFASTPRIGDTADRLMRNADIALYEAKEGGRNRGVLFSVEMAEAVAERHMIETDLRAALRLDQLRLHYQPIVSATDLRIVGVEALLRWEHPTRGFISPAVFVPIAERAGLMPQLGLWVVQQAFADARIWPELHVAVNLSPLQFRNFDLAATLEELCHRHQVDPHRIQLEITEGVLMDATDDLKAMFATIREMGFQLSLDDFGTGYSGLSYLRDFSFDKVKIDRSFVHQIDHSSKALTILQAVVLIAKGHNMTVVAEGVETEAEEEIARLAGCDQLQGFRFSRPVPANAISEALHRQAAEYGPVEAPGR